MIRANLSPVDLAWVDTNNGYVYAKHLELLNNALMDVADGKIKRLMVTMPPRHGKSELCSKYFPAWYLGIHPECRIILSSYEAGFAAEWGSKVRNLIDEYGHLFEVPIRIDPSSSAKNRWDIYNHKGGMQTAGVGGAITGKGAKILIIDDPVKNSEQAHSQTFRDKAKEWYNSTAYTRLEPDGAVILIQTRWHEDDLGGWLIADSDEDWTVIDLPAIAIEDNDALGRKAGDPLWPDRFNLKRLEEIKKQVGSYWFSAMYQQQPQPPEGGILKRSWLQYYDKLPGSSSNSVTYTGWDLAISEKETADYTCSCTIRVDNNTGHIYIVDWSRDHIDFPTQQKIVPQMQNKHQAALIGIEDNAYQAALPQSLRGLRLPIKTRTAIKDKVTKITSTFTLIEQGIVYLPNDHSLLKTFENEYAMFPTGKHDDLLDATEMALAMSMLGSNPYTSTDSGYEYSKYKTQQTRRRR